MRTKSRTLFTRCLTSGVTHGCPHRVAFALVLSHCGSFTNIRGGHELPYSVREVSPAQKPIRVFLQSGTADLDIAAGNWFVANLTMEAALKFGGFEHRVAWGTGGHDRWHGTAILPESLQWLWEGWQDQDPGK